MILTTPAYKTATGLSLVELMVAITISSVLLLGVSSVYLSSRTSNAVQDEFGRLQENGRFAVQHMVKEIRQAGYMGCVNLKFIKPNNIVDASGSRNTNFDLHDPTDPKSELSVIGHNDCDNAGVCSPAVPVTSIVPLEGTDAITIRKASNCNSTLAGNLGAANANIQMADNSCGFEAGDVLFINDCESGDIFRAGTVSSSSGKITVPHPSSVNTTNFLSKTYDQNARVMKFERLTYYIADGANGNPSLWVTRYDSDGGADSDAPTELVENVEDMQIIYGVDTDEDSKTSVDRYMTAAEVETADQWHLVRSLKLSLLTTTRDNLTKQRVDYKFQGVSGTPSSASDRRYRREFTTSINIRNRTL